MGCATRTSYNFFCFLVFFVFLSRTLKILAARKDSLHSFPPKTSVRLFLLKELKTESTKKLST